jgi:anaerobic selenocysteine-containing dehydrogenase
MKKDKTDVKTDRRSFLKLAGAGVVGSGAAAAASVVPAAADTAEAEPGSGYRESEHVRRYYELAKFM